MKCTLTPLLFLATVLRCLLSTAGAQEQAPGSELTQGTGLDSLRPGLASPPSPPTDYSTAAANPAMHPSQDVPGLPRVLLIGDSISIGYTLPVRERLAGKANVHRIPENGGPTTNGLARLDAWLGTQRWDVIHFNWGLHDLKLMDNGQQQVALPDYERNLDHLVERLKQTGARLMWASTTPVPEGKLKTPRRPEDVPSYNEAARKVMEKHRIPINDLYAFALPQLSRIQIPTNVHFTKEGSAALAQPVAEATLTSLKRASAAGQRRPGLVGPCYGNADFTRAKGSDLLRTMAPEFDSETGFGSSWSAMWQGELVAPVSTNMTFRVKTSGRVTVEIANTKILETQDGLGTGTVKMLQDRAYPIQVYYSHQSQGKGSFRLEWSWPEHEPAVIPKSRISHTAAQEEYWNWRPEPDPATIDRSTFARGPGNPNTDWFSQSKYGVFMHFLPDDAKSHALVKDFAVDALASQLEAMGAKYFVLTLGQNSGFMNSPNAAYEKRTGYAPGERCSTRDLPLDLYRALQPKGIRLMLYLPCQVPNKDTRAQKAFGLPQGAKDQPIDLAFAEKWSEVIQEWSDRYGDKVSGWWFDGGYEHIGFNDAIADRYADAGKHGNPKAIVTFNPGIKVIRWTKAEDYTAGELNDPLDAIPAGRWLEGSQWHALTYVGDNWGRRNTRFSNTQWVEWVRKVTAQQGVVTLDMGPNFNAAKEPVGSLAEVQVNQVKAIRTALARSLK